MLKPTQEAITIKAYCVTYLQWRVSLEGLRAHWTLVLPLVRVDLQVGVVCVVGAEREATDRANVLVVVVRLQVALEAVRILEPQLTLVARVRPLVRVDDKVGA